MKIISRYVVREHVGPFAFAITALTSLMLLNYIAKNFGQLVGKGLPKGVIAEFFALALPFTVAMTLPMAVLVAVLYAFQRLASENEVTAFKASGVSMQRLLVPALALGFLFALVMLAFNDQFLPRANHRLAQLQRDIFRASPTFALKEQVINPIKEGQLYLRAGRITRGSAHMKEVVLYDLSDPVRRRTIYADSGRIEFAPNRQDLYMTLFHGVMREIPTDRPDELTQLYYQRDMIRVKDVVSGFEESERTSDIKSDREMSICEMQTRYEELELRYQMTVQEYKTAIAEGNASRGVGRAPVPQKFVPRRPTGLGGAYCKLQRAILKATGSLPPKAAHAQTVARTLVQSPVQAPAQSPAQGQTQDTARARAQRDSIRRDSLRRAATADSLARARAGGGATAGATAKAPPVSGATTTALPGTPVAPAPQPVTPPVQQPVPSTTVPNPANPATQVQAPPMSGVPGASGVPIAPNTPGAQLTPGVVPPGVVGNTSTAAPPRPQPMPGPTLQPIDAGDTRVRAARDAMRVAREGRNRFAVEIQKKFSLAAACFIFVLVGAPLALRFPRGGVGMVIGVSLAIFAVSYVGLIGGEALADKALLSPFWAMWAANIMLFVLGLVLTLRMGRESSSGRGGGIVEWWTTRRERRALRAAGQAA